MFPKPVLSSNVNPVTSNHAATSANATIRVIMLNGDFTSLAFSPDLTINAVKIYVCKELKVPVNKQRLLLNGKELKVDVVFCVYSYLLN